MAVSSPRFPRFADLPPEQRTEAAIRASWADPPVVRMRLADAEEAARHTRGAYELSKPDICVDLALKRGPEATQWLTREVDVRRSSRPNWAIHLVEVTPLQDAEGHLNMKWQIEVEEEPALRAELVQRAAVRGSLEAAQRRAEAAG